MRQWRWSAVERDRLRLAADAYRQQAAKPEASSSSRPAGFHPINAEVLRHKELPPEQWIIDEKLPAGCTVLAGRSKDGKSMMAYGLVVAVATGGAAFGTEPVTQGDVLYLALEDGERRAQKRLQAQCEQISDEVDLSRLELVLWKSSALGAGLEEDLNTWIASKPAPRLIIIDILEKVRPRRTKKWQCLCGSVWGNGATDTIGTGAQYRHFSGAPCQ